MFVNNDGVIEVAKPFPVRMSWERALKFSIKKWEFILSEVQKGKVIEDGGGGHTCALCHTALRFYDEWCGVGCPVSIKTERTFCKGTPFESVDINDEVQIQAEIDFLKSL